MSSATQTSEQIFDNLLTTFSRKAAWTQGTSARNIDGNTVPSDSPNAICWCVMGAITRTSQQHWGNQSDPARWSAVKRVIDALAATSEIKTPDYYVAGSIVVHGNDSPLMTYDKLIEWIKRAKTKLGEANESNQVH